MNTKTWTRRAALTAAATGVAIAGLAPMANAAIPTQARAATAYVTNNGLVDLHATLTVSDGNHAASSISGDLQRVIHDMSQLQLTGNFVRPGGAAQADVTFNDTKHTQMTLRLEYPADGTAPTLTASSTTSGYRADFGQVQPGFSKDFAVDGTDVTVVNDSQNPTEPQVAFIVGRAA